MSVNVLKLKFQIQPPQLFTLAGYRNSQVGWISNGPLAGSFYIPPVIADLRWFIISTKH